MLFTVPPGIQVYETNISVSKRGNLGVPNGNTTTEYSVLITAPTTRPGVATDIGVVSLYLICCTFSVSVLCLGELPEYFTVYYESNLQHCPDVDSIASLDTTASGDIWQIWSVVQLGSNCNYTVHIVSHNEAGEMNSTGTLSIS